MPNLSANRPNDLPFRIASADGTQLHHVGVHGSILQFRAHHASRRIEIGLDAFVDHLLLHGESSSSKGSNNRFVLHDDSGFDAGWISFTETHVVVKAPESKRKLELDFDALKVAVETVARRAGGAA